MVNRRMREYQPKKDGPYRLPKAVYYQALYAVRDYDRLRREYDDILHASASLSDGQPRGTGIGDPTERKVERLLQLGDRITAIERALAMLPEEYRKGVLNSIRYQSPYPYIAGRETWGKQRRRFLFFVAQNLGLY